MDSMDTQVVGVNPDGQWMGFEYDEDQFVRTTIDGDGQTWFLAMDICSILGLKNVSQALTDLDTDEKTDIAGNNVGSETSKLRAINESGLYTLILKSRKPEAKAFRRWITHEVLPKIRQTGSYATPVVAEDAAVGPVTPVISDNVALSLLGAIDDGFAGISTAISAAIKNGMADIQKEIDRGMTDIAKRVESEVSEGLSNVAANSGGFYDE